MKQPIYFYILRDGSLLSRTAKYADALDLAHSHQEKERGNLIRSHYTIIKGCEQGVPYVEVTP